MMMGYTRDETAIIIGAINESKLIGLLWGYIIERLGDLKVHITQYGVLEEFRGNGVGSHLLCMIEKKASEMKIDYLELNVDIDNRSAVSFYHNNSFVDEKILMTKRLK
jgi:ribosomal protein S18 acetylase RimI-like enzyme